MSNLVFIEDKIINKDKISYIDVYTEETDFREVNDTINLFISHDFNGIHLYFFKKHNDFNSVEFDEKIEFCIGHSIAYRNYHAANAIIYIDSSLCSNKESNEYKDIYKFYSYIEYNQYRCDDIKWIVKYARVNSKPILKYGAKIYMDNTPVKEIKLQTKYSSKEEILNYFK